MVYTTTAANVEQRATNVGVHELRAVLLIRHKVQQRPNRELRHLAESSSSSFRRIAHFVLSDWRSAEIHPVYIRSGARSSLSAHAICDLASTLGRLRRNGSNLHGPAAHLAVLVGRAEHQNVRDERHDALVPERGADVLVAREVPDQAAGLGVSSTTEYPSCPQKL